MPPRNDQLSQQNVIIIAVCAAFGGLVVLFILHRLFRNTSRRTPLPPVQPLARHREQQLQQFQSRPGTFYEPSYLLPPFQAPFQAPSLASSKASLLRPITPTASTDHDNLSPSPSSPDIPLEHALPLPNHSFSQSPSSSSIGSSENAVPETPVSPVISSATTQLRSQKSLRSQSSITSSSSRPRSSYTSRPRPLSVVSTSSAARSNHHTIRGVPHGPHSNVQIVLPAPLAPSVVSSIVYEDNLSRRSSVFEDKWVRNSVHSRSSSTGDRRASMHGSEVSFRTTRRVSSISSLSRTSQYSPNNPPPVPRIPSVYNSHSPDQAQDWEQRGRSDRPEPSHGTEPPLQPRALSQPPPKRKRSKSRHKAD